MSGADSSSKQSFKEWQKRQTFVLLKRLLKHSPGLKTLYARVSPDMPDDLVAQPYRGTVLGKADASAPVQRYNHDEGHAGAYTVPGAVDAGASVSSAYVHARSDPLAYIRQHLLLPCPTGSNAEELVFLSPGLNTPHEPAVRDIPAPQRAVHYIRVLQTIPLAHLHLGSSLDQPSFRVGTPGIVSKAYRDVLALAAKLGGASKDDGSGANDKVDIETDPDGVPVLTARAIDIMQAGLSEYNLVDTPLKQAFRSLIDMGAPLTFIAYSRSSMELKAALKWYIEEHVTGQPLSKKSSFAPTKPREKSDVQKDLRERITVVTVGSACRGFPNGPAYLHVSSRDDVLCQYRGVSESYSVGAGSGAVFVHCNTPYAPRASEHHNFAVAAAPLLSVALAWNRTNSFRTLWEAATAGKPILPPNIDALVSAVTVLSGGADWMFDRTQAMKNVPADAFPSPQRAESLLRESLGDRYTDGLIKTFEEEYKPSMKTVE